MSSEPAPPPEAPDGAPEWPPFDPASYVRVGDHLIAAAGAQPQLGLRLARAMGIPGSSAPYWFIGTLVATAREADDSDIAFSTFTPFLGDLAKRMDDGDFTVWVDGLAEGYAAGLIHRIRRTQKTNQLTKARLSLETSLATAATEPQRPSAAPVDPQAPPDSVPEAVPHHFTELEGEVRIFRRSRR